MHMESYTHTLECEWFIAQVMAVQARDQAAVVDVAAVAVAACVGL